MVDLGTLGGNFCIVFAINNRRQVVGGAALANSGQIHAVLYHRSARTDAGAAVSRSGQRGGARTAPALPAALRAVSTAESITHSQPRRSSGSRASRPSDERRPEYQSISA
jgi:hypothetical protein